MHGDAVSLKEQLAKVAAWWMDLPEDALDHPIEAFTNLDILASAVPELLVENARLRAIIIEFMRQEGHYYPSRQASRLHYATSVLHQS